MSYKESLGNKKVFKKNFEFQNRRDGVCEEGSRVQQACSLQLRRDHLHPLQLSNLHLHLRRTPLRLGRPLRQGPRSDDQGQARQKRNLRHQPFGERR